MSTKELLRNTQVTFLMRLDSDKQSMSMSTFRAESLKMGGVYWGLSAMRLLDVEIPPQNLERLNKFALSCFDDQSGGFGWSTGHDAHITATHYALLIFKQTNYQIIASMKEKILLFCHNCQNENGSIMADKWGESDLRFAYNVACIQTLLLGDRRTAEKWSIDRIRLEEYILSCQNFDSAFAPSRGLESHAAYTFCGIGALKLMGCFDTRNPSWINPLCHWLAERQTPTGGFNGRPEKAPDVCYSWWILSTLEMLGKSDWIDKQGLGSFILRSQDPENGGIADRPECVPDVFHTFFGLAGLSLIDREKYGIRQIDVELASVL
jgi:geranylgeranyl transferase type-2 subunit beta